jgi:hypothetical protein
MQEGRKIRADEIDPLLRELGDRLAARGETGSVYIYGGAAVVLRYKARNLTDDVDARMAGMLRRESEQMAAEHDLPTDWLNDHGSHFLPMTNDTEADIVVYGGLTVRIASPRFLLAGKLYASRVKDQADIRTLLRELHIARAAEAVAIVRDIYGEDTVPSIDFEDLEMFVDEMLRAIRREDAAA